MNDQQVFDTVAAHLLAQGVRSMTEVAGVCAYRGFDGLRCAVGCLIPDDRYGPELEGLGVDQLAVIDALPWKLGPDQLGFLMDLQRIHDQTEVEDWQSELVELAGRQGLRAEVLE